MPVEQSASQNGADKKTEGPRRLQQTEDLALVRSTAPNLAQSWMLLHRIDEGSPLHGLSPEDLVASEAELSVALSGTDDTSRQPVHGRHIYEHTAIVWGARLVDVLSETPEGDIQLDLTRFHDLEPTPPSERFAYPRKGPGY